MSEKKPVYKKLDLIDHILLRPETYIGSVNSEDRDMYILNNSDLKDINVIKKQIEYNPGLIKLFDEVLVNASDHSIRTGKVKVIKINISNENISIENDGPPIPIELHKEEKVYNPELIFGHLLTGENYDDSEERVVGGRNGLGAKLANIFSKKFIVECCDGKKKYHQTFENNMKKINKPKIEPSKTKTFTKITFFPEFERFKMKHFSEDLKLLMFKRCLDIAVYNTKVKVILNNKEIPIKSVKDYMQMHLKKEASFFYEKLSNGWEVGIAKSDNNQFEQISLVNGINTYRGGTHVSYVSNQLSKDVADSFSKKIKAQWTDVKNNLFIFLISQVPNPEFDTQTKENLTKYISKEIHQNSKISDITIKKIMKSEIVESILYAIQLKEKEELRRLQKNQKNITIEKLIDATSQDRSKCQLFIFEGDSAAEYCRIVRSHQTQGIFKLKGKFMNTTKMTDKKILQDEKGNATEASQLMLAIGLDLNSPVKKNNLRFSEIIIATDADTDGDSIFALLVNFFSKWPELFEMGLIKKVMTPLLTITKGNVKKQFYTQEDWEKYTKTNSLSGWEVIYKKGLGSLSDDEYNEMINNPKLLNVILDSDGIENLNCWFGDDVELRKNELI